MSSPALTVCLPTYNRAELLPAAIDSALAERELPLELLVLDNASDDGSAELLAAIDDPRLRVVRHPRTISMYANHNAALEHAACERIVFLHSDDRLPAGALRALHAASEAAPEAGLIFGAKHYYLAAELPLRLSGVADVPTLLRWPNGAVSGALFSAETLRRFPFDETSLISDYGLMHALLRSGGALVVLPEPTCEIGEGAFQASVGWFLQARYYDEMAAVLRPSLADADVKAGLLAAIGGWTDNEIITLLLTLATMGEGALIRELEAALAPRVDYRRLKSYHFIRLYRVLGRWAMRRALFAVRRSWRA